MTHDSLVIQDGRYELTFWQNGLDMEGRLGARQMAQLDRSQPRFAREGQISSVAVAIGPSREFRSLIDGPIASSLGVDFYPLLERAGIRTESYIQLSDGDLNDDAQKRCKKRASGDSKLEGFRDLPGGRSVNRRLLEALYIDAAAARALNLPFSTASDVRPIADWGIQRTVSRLAPDPTMSVYQRWVSMRLPDFSQATWSELHDIRESPAGRDFRVVLERISQRVTETLPHVQNESEIQALIDGEFLREATADAVAKVPVLQRVMQAIGLDIGLNLLGLPLPASSGVAAATEVFGVLKERRQWISLIGWRSKAEGSSTLKLRD